MTEGDYGAVKVVLKMNRGPESASTKIVISLNDGIYSEWFPLAASLQGVKNVVLLKKRSTTFRLF